MKTGLAIAALLILGTIGPPRYAGTGCTESPIPWQLARETWRLDDCATVYPLISESVGFQ